MLYVPQHLNICSYNCAVVSIQFSSICEYISTVSIFVEEKIVLLLVTVFPAIILKDQMQNNLLRQIEATSSFMTETKLSSRKISSQSLAFFKVILKCL